MTANLGDHTSRYSDGVMLQVAFRGKAEEVF